MKKLAFILAILFLLAPVTAFLSGASEEDYRTEGDWVYKIVDGAAQLVGYNGSDTDITVPAKLGGKKVKSIAGAFNDNKSVVSVKLPKGLIKIDGYSFKGCAALKSVSMPDTLEYIGELAFYNCSSYSDVKIPKSVTVIENRAFEGTGYYNDVSHRENDILYCGDCLIEAFAIGESCEIKKGTRVICTGAFYNKRDLKTVTLPDSLEYINRDAFMYCPLESLTIPANVKKIYKYAFSDCAKLKSVTFAKNSKLTAIEGGAFSHCTSLKAIKLPDSVKSIGGGAFSGCSQLSDISFPKTIEFIGANAFYETGAYGNKNNWSDRMFYLCDCLLDTDKNLNRSSFTVREGTVYIGENVFVRAEYFTEIHIPASVKRIDVNAFYLQYKIKTVYYGGTKSEWETVGKDSVSFLKKIKLVCKGEEHKHSFGEWTVVNEPTCLEQGKNVRYCTTCNAEEVQYTDKIDHVYDENGLCIYCGDLQGYVEPDPVSQTEEASEPVTEEISEEFSEEESAIYEESEIDEPASEAEEQMSEVEEASEEFSEEISVLPAQEDPAESAPAAPAQSEEESAPVSEPETEPEPSYEEAVSEPVSASSQNAGESSTEDDGDGKSSPLPYIVIGVAVVAIAAVGGIVIIRKRG